MTSVLPPEDKGASHVNEILVVVVEITVKFVGADGGSEMIKMNISFFPSLRNRN